MRFVQFIKNIFRKEPNIVIRVPATDPVDALIRAVNVETVKPKRKKHPTRKFGSISATFKERAKRMKIGQTRTFHLPNLAGLTLNRYSAVISSWCVANWGKGAAITRRKGDAIVLKRIA